MIEMAEDAIIIGKGNYLDCNKASLDLFGCSSHEQIYGKTPFDFSPPTQPDGSDSKERSIQIVKKALAGEPQRFYWRHRKVDGTLIETEVSLSRIEVRGDFVLLGIIRDITERKQAEEALEKSEQKYRRIFESVQDVYYEVTMDGIILELSPSIEEVSQYKREELIGKSLYHIYVDPKKRDEFVKKLQDKGKVSDYEILLKDKEGSEVCCSITARLMTDNQGRPVKIIGSLRNINERMRGGEALQKARDELERRVEERTAELLKANEQLEIEIEERERTEEKYKTLVESSLTGIFIHQDGKYVFMNDRFGDTHGYQPGELLGRDPLTLIHPDEREALRQVLSKRLKGESAPNRYEVRRLKKDGETIWCEMMVMRIEYAGRPAIMGNVIDITERKQAEEALLESTRRLQLAYDQAIAYAKELNKEIDERKRAEEALQRRKEQLKAKAQSLEEVNTALKVLLKQREEDKTELEEKVLSNVKQLVLPYIETLRKSRLGDEQMAYVSIIESNLTDIVSPFLRKLSSKYLRLTPKEIQIADLVKIGKTTKEIADLLNVSTRAIEFHRENIRAKLGLKNQPINLRTQLLSFE